MLSVATFTAALVGLLVGLAWGFYAGYEFARRVHRAELMRYGER